MRKNSGTLNSQLSRVFSELGHTDHLVVTDAGLPIPQHVERVDLALVAGIPSFLQVLDQTLAEIVIEGAVAQPRSNNTTQRCSPPCVSDLTASVSS